MYAIEHVRRFVRTLVRQVARALNTISNGRVTPNHITLLSLILHVWIAWTIINSQLFQAGLILIVFGLMDVLDGELARLQKRESNMGVVYDASSDRAKEALIYAGLAVYLAKQERFEILFVAVIALGTSLLISFVKAKGETVLATVNNDQLSIHQLNKLLGKDSLMRFEIRIAVLILGLLTGFVGVAVGIVAVLGIVSVIARLAELDRVLGAADSTKTD